MYKVVITLAYSFQSNNIAYIFRRDRNMAVRLILIGHYGLCNKISSASITCILIFSGCLTAQFDLSEYKLLKLKQSTALEQKRFSWRFDLRSLSPALRNLWLLLVDS